MRPILVIALGLASVGCTDDDESSAIEFLNIRTEDLAGDRVVVRFETSVATDCEIQYGPGIAAMTSTAVDPEMEEGEMAVDHSVPIEDLLPQTTYYWRAQATDADGITALSETQSFTTLLIDDPTAGMTNVAGSPAGATVAEVSSNWSGGSNDSSFGANNAIDGSMASEWSSNGDGDDAYLVVDLGQSRTLQYVGYRSRKMSDGTSIVRSFELEIAGQTFGPFASPDPNERYVYEIDPAPTAAQVRWRAVETTGGNTGAKEIELY